MRVHRWIWRAVPFATVGLVAAAPGAFAQRGREIFEWNGRVDRSIQISMRGDRLATRDLGDSETGRQNSRVFMQLPREDGQLYVQLLSGRGSATVVEQPTARNGYTAVIRIDDPARGADDYRVAAYWQDYSNGDIYSRNGNGNANGRYDRRNSRDRSDRADRDDRDDRDDRGRSGSVNGARGGYNQSVLHWSGNVDGELELRIQNGQVSYRTLSGAQPTSIRADRGNAASQPMNGQVFVTQNQGRGSVTVVQQPSPYNGYTTVIRVRDPQGGYGFYDFDVMMQ